MRCQWTILLVCVGISGCATYPFGTDNLCRELASFANSIPPGTSYMVSLETSWGGSKLNPNAIYSRDCNHGNYTTGASFCSYLMEHSAVEFSEMNFRRALACVDNTPLKRKDYDNFLPMDYLNAKISSYGGSGGVFGVHKDIKVTVEYKPNIENETMQLNISAERPPAKP